MRAIIKHLGEGALFGLLTLSGIAPAAATSLRDAVERAWRTQPEAAARPEREAELSARRQAASAWTPDAPSVSIGHKTDRIDRDAGLREWEAEIGVPLWLPGQRDRQHATAAAEQDAYGQTVSAARWRLAGEVREAYWAVRLTDNGQRLAARKVEQTERLAADVERRVEAGDLPKVDLNQARIVERQARAALAQAEAASIRARRHFAALTDGAPLPDEAEPAVEAETLAGHPRLLALQAEIQTLRARLAETAADRRDNPELGLAVGRERDSRLDAYGHTLSVRLRVPFASAGRNRPRLYAAHAALSEAEARLEVETRKLNADIESARAERQAAEQSLSFAEARQRLSQENHAWISKAFRLGELDLAARLRAEADRFEADLNLSRAQLETARAVSRLNQALGALP